MSPTRTHRPRASSFVPRRAALSLALALSVLALVPAAALAQVIKLATLVPEGSVWDKSMRDMGAEWSAGTQNRVSLRVYPGGVAGDEPDLVRKMRIGQLQAAAVTTAGLANIDPAFNVFNIPMFFTSYPELYATLAKLEPVLRQRLEEKGFVLLSWGHGGWVYFFTKAPVATVDGLRKTKMFVWAGDDRMVTLWKTEGFQPIPLAATDIMTALQTGMIDSYPTTPLLGLTLQWYRQTPNMVGMGMAPLVGGLVMTKAAWSKIPPADQKTIQAACLKLQRRLEVEVPRQDTTAVAEMQKRGLKVNPVVGASAAEFRASAERFAGGMKGVRVPPEILELARRERDAFRARSGGRPTTDAAAHRPNPLAQFFRRLEGGLLVAAFLVSMLLPLVDALGRLFGGFGIPGSATYRAQLTLWMAFLGGLLATREGRHLTLSTAEAIGHARVRDLARHFALSVAAAVCAALAYSAVGVVAADRTQGEKLAIGLPLWISECVMPVALALIALRLAWSAGDSWKGRAVAFASIGVAFGLGAMPAVGHGLWLPLLALIIAATLVGSPVFVAMGGVAVVLFFKDSVPVSAVTAEIYRLMVSPTLPAIPLLTACGYVLAESNASHRLVRFFRALFGWMPGGVAVLVVAVCALFTTFTGGSGITIMALGGLLYPILLKDRYPEGFSLGLVTASGSLGLLFPPSLPVILYAIVANVPADSLYLAGLIPGTLLVVIVGLYGVHMGKKVGSPRQPFSAREALHAAWSAKWELTVPVMVVVLFSTGLATMVEAAAIAFAYAIVIECFVTHDIHPTRALPGVLLKAGVLCGSVLILLASALGLTSWLVDAQIPDALLGAVRTHIHSPHVFLLVLNVVLLVLGSVLEIYSAIIILAPLVAPIGAAFGIDPVHLGIVFLANLELGFLFPPVGLNLFLASSRFDKPLPQLYRHVVPFLIIIAIGVLMITYMPWMTTGILRLLGK